MLSIGAFSRLCGVSAKALRAYDALGLFRPVWVDPGSRYRYYSPAQIPEIRRVVALRDLGMGLSEIRALTRNRADLRDALERRRAQLEHERRELERRLARLEIQVATAGSGRGPLDVVIRVLPTEPVAVLPLAIVDDRDVSRAFYELEAHVRDLRRRAPRPPGALVPRRGADRGDVEVFVPVSGAISATGRIGYRTLPAARAATVIHRGPYASVGVVRRHLEHWVEAAGHSPAGPLRVLYLQFGAEAELRVPSGYVVERPADYVTELQLPIA
jgi:DNA-binding transcriptional MerR regulator